MNADEPDNAERDDKIRVEITRLAKIPDRLRLLRYRKAPEYGPRILFFSGGSALNPLSRALVDYTHNSIHLVTPFDSGGSSGKLRQVMDVPAVGDLRSRLMALADRTIKGQTAVYELFVHRLPKDASPHELKAELTSMAAGDHPLVRVIRPPLRELIQNHLGYFQAAMPDELDLRGASIGNLVLVGGYVNNHHDIQPVVFLFSQLVEVRGTVRPIVAEAMHLTATLEDGMRIVCQHNITGKETDPIVSPIADISITDADGNPPSEPIEVDDQTLSNIRKADMICFPMGSFYTSLIANLLPRGVGWAIAQRSCPKVFIPSTSADPEQVNMSLAGAAETLLKYLRADAGPETPVNKLINLTVLDQRDDSYGLNVDVAKVESLGIKVIRSPLVERDTSHIAPERLIEILFSLV